MSQLPAVLVQLPIQDPDPSLVRANVPLAAGLPALALGAGGRGGGMHTPSEWFNPEGRDLGL